MIFIPYLIVESSLAAVKLFIFEESFVWYKLIASIIGIWPNHVLDSSMWYITYLFFLYIIFAVAISKKSKNWKYGWLIIEVIISILVLPLFLRYTSAYAFNFAGGVVYCDLIKASQSQNNESNRYLLYILGIVGFLLQSWAWLSNSNLPIIVTFGNLLIPAFYLFFAKLVSRGKFLDNLLKKIGECSYELYLIEAIFMYQYKFIFDLIGYTWFGFGAYFVCIFAIAWSFHKFMGFLLNKN